MPPRSSLSACQSASSDSTLFACSPGASSWLRARSRSERELGVHAVDPGDPRVADQLDRAVAGDELAQPLEGARLDVDAAGGEDGPVDILGARIRGIVVERPPLLVERPERCLVLPERPVAAGDAAPCLLGVDLDENRQGALPQAPSGSCSVPTAPPPSAITAGALEARASQRVLRLAQPECHFAAGLEDPSDRLFALDLCVDVDERPPELRRRARRRASTCPRP